jgi:hypothetical protein
VYVWVSHVAFSSPLHFVLFLLFPFLCMHGMLSSVFLCAYVYMYWYSSPIFVVFLLGGGMALYHCVCI